MEERYSTMDLQVQGNKNQCFIHSVAMILDTSVDILIAEIGHDGLSIDWPDQPIPYCYRGHHLQEALDCCIKRGYGLMNIEVRPAYSYKHDGPVALLWEPEYGRSRLINLIKGRRAVISSPTHSVAWDGTLVFDPNGKIYPISDLINIVRALVLTRL